MRGRHLESPNMVMQESTSSPLLARFEEQEAYPEAFQDVESPLLQDNGHEDSDNESSSDSDSSCSAQPTVPLLNGSVSRAALSGPDEGPETSHKYAYHPGMQRRGSSQHSISRRSDSVMSSTNSIYSLSNIMNLANRGTSPAKNAFIITGEALYAGCTCRNILKGFLWSLAITSMHYVGITALRIPSGYSTLEPGLVVLSALISWAVCLVGCILMARIETQLAQQFLFALVACGGVAAMHFTGMRAVTFWSYNGPSVKRGYPSMLAVAIGTIAIITCIAANFLLAHVATLSRNKLAEIVMTRKQLWKTIALKENAEAAAAARSDFIASASHEIRTPLHHLQGYSDLLSQTQLTEEGRTLLYAIQHATKTLSLITNNVLDWSKLEKDVDASCRPVPLDMRTVCESTLLLLPNKDDEDEVELMVVVSPEVPHSLFLDETYIQRIIMNLLSNALKFTRSGYILLLIEICKGDLIATVKDTGSGIPPSFLPQLFQPFKQATTRGSQRGTGLGMSIIKQLLNKMGGSIEVQSNHPDEEGVESGQTGTTFTVRIPIQLSNSPKCPPCFSKASSVIAVFDSNERYKEGLRTSWATFGVDIVGVDSFFDLFNIDCKYVWTDLEFLKRNKTVAQQLIEEDKWLILVPCDNKGALKQVPRLSTAHKVIPLQKPLIWHTFEQQIKDALEQPAPISPERTVRFAPKVEIVAPAADEHSQEDLVTKNLTVLLVEDNPINQKLGRKMLNALKYEVITADDGGQAIEQIMKHDDIVDAILMDQSMPVKDGVTATREIRELEASGMLSRRRPIIAVTAVVSTEAQNMFRAAGADDFLTKPLALGKLGQTLAAYLPQG